MMFPLFRYTIAILFLCILHPLIIPGQNKTSAHISGYLSMDDSWSPIIYLSHIPTFEDMYAVSNEMIIAKTGIDSLGHFKFDINFLPKGENLYRLHVVKKGDTPASLIIGGKDENHLFLLADRLSDIQLSCNSGYSPFKNVSYKNSKENVAFQKVSNLVFIADSISAESTASKRLLIEYQLQRDLLLIADTSANFLVSLYAIYKSKFESNYAINSDFYKSYIKKWKNQDNAYFKVFSKKIPVESSTNAVIIIVTSVASILVFIGFFLGKRGLRTTNKIEKLSIQERKIYELLQQGATNQDISNHFNIGLSTVKSHVSSIYSKLNIKSRKNILNMK